MVDRERIRMAGWALAAAVAVVLAVRLLGSGAGGHEPGPIASGPSPAVARRPPAAGPELLVQVAGEVERPGVYRVAAGARVNDAVAHAGGLTRRADPAGVNLVARVQDGQQVVVPRRGAAAATSAGATGVAGTSGAAPSAGPVSLSSATVAQLDTLDGIGPTLAERIVEYRQSHGGFSSIDQLRQVDGIGEKRFAALKKGVVP
jgi:competence protein ComEA